MNFSAFQWLASIVVDVLIKFLLVAAAGLFVTFGLVSTSLLLMPAVLLSLLHFVCLFLGTASVLLLELRDIQPSPVLRAIVSVVVANMLFVAILVVLIWPGPNDIPRTADGPVVVALVLASTNLFTLSVVSAGTRLIRWIRRCGRPKERATSS